MHPFRNCKTCNARRGAWCYWHDEALEGEPSAGECRDHQGVRFAEIPVKEEPKRSRLPRHQQAAIDAQELSRIKGQQFNEVIRRIVREERAKVQKEQVTIDEGLGF